MPNLNAQGKTSECAIGDNLRQGLLKNKIDLYRGDATVINGHSVATCGTCSVEICGDASAIGWRENARLALSPHSSRISRQLACQVHGMGDLQVTQLDGFWG